MLRFVSELTVYSPNMFIFMKLGVIREMHTGVMLIAGEESLLGPTLKLLVRGQHMSAIAFMSVDRLLDCHTEEGSVDGDMFFSQQFRGYLSHIISCHLILTV